MLTARTLYSMDHSIPGIIKRRPSVSTFFFYAFALLGGLIGGIILESNRIVLCQSSSEWTVQMSICSNLHTALDPPPTPTQEVIVRLKPVLIELVSVAVLHALGVRVLRNAPKALAKLRLPMGRLVTGAMKITKLVYKRTSASKVVTRIKKIKKLVKKLQKKKYQEEEPSPTTMVASLLLV